MQRREIAKSMGLSGILATCIAPAIVSAQPQIRWRMASSFHKSLDIIHGAAKEFAEVVSRLTNGRLQILIHGAGELMPPLAVADAVSKREVEIAHTAAHHFYGKDPTFAISSAIPFGMNSRQMTAWLFEGNGLKLMREFYGKYDIVNYPAGNTGAQMAGWFRKEIKSADDFQGLKIRIGGFAGMVLRHLGSVPKHIEDENTLLALKSGSVDAAQWMGPYDDLRLGLHEVASNYYYPGWWEGGLNCDFFVNSRALQQLPKAYRDVIGYASKVVHVNTQAKYDERNSHAVQQLIAGGAKLREFDSSVMFHGFKAAMDLYTELSAGLPSWRWVYQDYRKFQRDQNDWFGYSERSFDRFMQQQRL